ncbi:MAG: DUF4091 domain-containing protein [Clostridia bacterium]|nr:DUF4091 domain-containing protein [Clostridia bacterium]
MSKGLKQILALCLATMMLLTSCVAHQITPPDLTETSAPSESDSALETEKETSTEANDETKGTEALTDPSTEAPTEVPTEAPTELPTEAPTEEETDPVPQPPVNTAGDCGNEYWKDNKKVVGQVRLDVVKHEITQTDYAKSVNKSGNWSVKVGEDSGMLQLYGWIGFSFDSFELGWRIGTDSEVAYTTENASPVTREAAVLQAAKKEGYTNATGYSFLLNLNEFKSGEEVHLFLKDTATDTIYCFCELTINVNTVSADLSSSALKEKYELGYGSDMDMSDYDPITDKETIVVPDDDPTVKLWFDHITEKVARYDLSGMNSGALDYTIQMGKNEIEGCQFFLYSPTNKKVTIKISDFTNDKGETLATELGVEYYMEDGYVTHNGFPASYVYPDAVVPYDSYIAYSSNVENGRYGMDADSKIDYGPYVLIGPFSGSDWNHEKYPFRDSIRGFVVEATTTKDTTPGAYKATIEIYDEETGKCIKAANVYTYVYDVTLSDETAMDTAFGLWDIVSVYNHQYNENPELTRYTDVEITKATAEFFLKHRITLTGSITYFNMMGADWFKNPRVTSLRVLTKDQYDSIKSDPVLAKKMFYYGQDEPGVPRGWRPITWPDGTSETVYDNTGLLSVLAIAREADQLKNIWGWEDYRLLTPFERDLDFKSFNFNSVDKNTAFPAWYDEYAVASERDAIEYLAKHGVNVWAPHLFSYTPRDLQKTAGSQYLQSVAIDKALGELTERLNGFVEAGGERWSYVSCEPKYTSPYQNILLFNDGTEGRTMFWTNYLNDVTGFLYWHVSYYDAAGNRTYQMRNPVSKTGPGDGILIYPGSAYGQLDPIPSLRLLYMRDGIEDYQMLTMLEEAMGEAYTHELVSHVTTSTLSYTRDDDVIYNVHSYLLRALEEASKS